MAKISLKQIENFNFAGGTSEPTVLYSYDMVGGDKFQTVKLIYGDEGLSEGYVSNSNPLPVAYKSPTTSIVTNYPAQSGGFEIMTLDQLRTGSTISNRTDDRIHVLFGEEMASAVNYTEVVPANATLVLGKEDYNGRISVYCFGAGSVAVTQFKLSGSYTAPNGTSLKTINNESLLGEGNITVSPVTHSSGISITVNGLNSTNVQDIVSELLATLNQVNQNSISLVNNKIPSSYLPDSLLGQVKFISDFDPNFPLPSPTAQNSGNYYIASVNGDVYKTGDWAVSNGDAWIKIDNTDAVSSVAGKTGAVVLEAGDVQSGVFSPLRIPEISWLKITSDKPNDLEGYGITNAAEKSNTLQGYGITNGVEKQQVNGVAGCAVDSMGNIRSLPIKYNSTSNYNLVPSDNGCAVVTTNTITIPAGIMAKGDIVMLFNDTPSSILLTTSAVTAYVTGIDIAVPSITLTARGACSVWFYDFNKIAVSGDVF